MLRLGRPHPTVSVVIPVKDDALLLRRCLRALQRQTRPVDEIVVVDNASADDSAEVALAAGARVIRCDQPGIAAASARGYDAATGDCILRLDADCVPGRSWVRTLTDALEPGVAVVSGGARFIDGPRPLRGVLAALYLSAYVASTVPALGHFPVFGSNLGFRRTAWLAVRDEIHRSPLVHDDLDLAYHFGLRHRIRAVRGGEMGMSMRPFSSARSFARRFDRGLLTVVLHWPLDFPPLRWARLAVTGVGACARRSRGRGAVHADRLHE